MAVNFSAKSLMASLKRAEPLGPAPTQRMLQLRARVLGHEQGQARLPNHTANVVEIVTRQIALVSPELQEQALMGAWAHSLSLGGFPGQCSGGPKPTIPEFAQLAKGLHMAQLLDDLRHFVHPTTYAGPEVVNVPQLIGAACAIDALRLPGAGSIDDVQQAWGYPRVLLERTAHIQEQLKPSTGNQRHARRQQRLIGSS